MKKRRPIRRRKNLRSDYEKLSFKNLSMHVLVVPIAKPEVPSNDNFEQFATGIGTDALHDDWFGLKCTMFKYVKFNYFVYKISVDVLSSGQMSGEYDPSAKKFKVNGNMVSEFFKREKFYINWDYNIAYDPKKIVTTKDQTSSSSKSVIIGSRKPVTFMFKVPAYLRRYVLCSELKAKIEANSNLSDFFYSLFRYEFTYLPNNFFGGGTELLRKMRSAAVYVSDCEFVLRIEATCNCTFKGAKKIIQ